MFSLLISEKVNTSKRPSLKDTFGEIWKCGPRKGIFVINIICAVVSRCLSPSRIIRRREGIAEISVDNNPPICARSPCWMSSAMGYRSERRPSAAISRNQWRECPQWTRPTSIFNLRPWRNRATEFAISPVIPRLKATLFRVPVGMMPRAASLPTMAPTTLSIVPSPPATTINLMPVLMASCTTFSSWLSGRTV